MTRPGTAAARRVIPPLANWAFLAWRREGRTRISPARLLNISTRGGLRPRSRDARPGAGGVASPGGADDDGMGQGEHRAPYRDPQGRPGVRGALPRGIFPSGHSIGPKRRGRPTGDSRMGTGGREGTHQLHPPPRRYPRHITTQAIPIGQTARRIDYSRVDLTTPHIRSRVNATHKEVPTSTARVRASESLPALAPYTSTSM